MSSFNKVILLGNLTRDPELRVTPRGTALTTFTLAVNRKFTTDGQEREEVLFIDVECWAKQAETIAKHVTKGQQLLVEGHLKLDQWDDKTTQQKRSKIKVVLGNFQFMAKGPLGLKDPPAAGGGSFATRFAPKPAAPAAQENLDEDVPF